MGAGGSESVTDQRNYFLVIWLAVILGLAFVVRGCERDNGTAECRGAQYRALRALPTNYLLRSGDLTRRGDGRNCCRAFVGRYLAADVQPGVAVPFQNLLLVPIIRDPVYRRLPIDAGLASSLNAGDYVDIFVKPNSGPTCRHQHVLAVLVGTASFAAVDTAGQCEQSLAISPPTNVTLLKVDYVPATTLPSPGEGGADKKKVGKKTANKVEKEDSKGEKK